MISYTNKIMQSDLVRMAANPQLRDALEGKTVLVTGASGMLATYITYLLCYLHESCDVLRLTSKNLCLTEYH